MHTSDTISSLILPYSTGEQERPNHLPGISHDEASLHHHNRATARVRPYQAAPSLGRGVPLRSPYFILHSTALWPCSGIYKLLRIVVERELDWDGTQTNFVRLRALQLNKVFQQVGGEDITL